MSTPYIVQTPDNEIGNYFPNGICTGPNQDTSFVINNNLPLTTPPGRSLSFGYGNGLINGSLCWYRWNPALPTNSVINSGVGVSSLAVGYEIPLQANTTNERGTQLFFQPDGTPTIQMDYARTVGFRVTGFSGATAASTISIKFTGVDVWGQPVVTQADLTIPASTANGFLVYPSTSPVYLQTRYVETPSALFQIIGNPVVTAITIGAGVASDATLALNAGFSFGLPYYLMDYGAVVNYSQPVNDIDGATPITQVFTASNQYQGSYIWPNVVDSNPGTNPPAISLNRIGLPQFLQTGLPLDQTVSAASNDVRGLIQPNVLVAHDLTDPPQSLYTSLADITTSQVVFGPFTFLYNVLGTDYMSYKYNQLMNGIQLMTSQGNLAQAASAWAGFGKPLDATNVSDEPNLNGLIGLIPYSGT